MKEKNNIIFQDTIFYHVQIINIIVMMKLAQLTSDLYDLQEMRFLLDMDTFLVMKG